MGFNSAFKGLKKGSLKGSIYTGKAITNRDKSQGQIQRIRSPMIISKVP